MKEDNSENANPLIAKHGDNHCTETRPTNSLKSDYKNKSK